MTFDKMLEELKLAGFKVILKGDDARLIKNRKAVNYSKAEWEKLGDKAKIIELHAIQKAFE